VLSIHCGDVAHWGMTYSVFGGTLNLALSIYRWGRTEKIGIFMSVRGVFYVCTRLALLLSSLSPLVSYVFCSGEMHQTCRGGRGGVGGVE